MNLSLQKKKDSNLKLSVLGITQDGGYPQANCIKPCCEQKWNNIKEQKMVTSIGIWDEISKKKWLIEATPDFKYQINLLNKVSNNNRFLQGVFITHAHVGHYTGLINFGKEIMDSRGIDVYVMPRMKFFLENNAPWSQLVKEKNIILNSIFHDKVIVLSESLSLKPVLVPHRDEYSETVGFFIYGPNKKVLFVPDIDKWHKWDQDICSLIKEVDLAFLDGTFFDAKEFPDRDISKIPHPFISESINLFSKLSKIDKQKIHFIHFNHTNPVLSKNYYNDLISDFNLSKQGSTFSL